MSLIFKVNSNSLLAQQMSATATSTISATIVTPIGITKTIDMNFGNLASSTSAGTVVLTPEGTRTVTGGISLVPNTGTVTAASFEVTGEGSYTYSISLPNETFTLKRTSGSETMLINNFTSIPSGSGKLISGTQTIMVGATLNIDADQTIGEYVSETSFNVTVNYN